MAAAPRVAATGSHANAAAVVDRDAAAASAGATPPDDPAASGPGEDAEADVASPMGRSRSLPASRVPTPSTPSVMVVAASTRTDSASVDFTTWDALPAPLSVGTARSPAGVLRESLEAGASSGRSCAAIRGLPRVAPAARTCDALEPAARAWSRFLASTAAPGLAARCAGGLCPDSHGRQASGLGAAGRLAPVRGKRQPQPPLSLEILVGTEHQARRQRLAI